MPNNPLSSRTRPGDAANQRMRWKGYLCRGNLPVGHGSDIRVWVAGRTLERFEETYDRTAVGSSDDDSCRGFDKDILGTTVTYFDAGWMVGLGPLIQILGKVVIDLDRRRPPDVLLDVDQDCL